MPLGFLKSAREPNRSVPGQEHAAPAARPDRAAVLGEVEELGIGMFWATDADGNLAFLSKRALADMGAEADSLIGKPLTQVFNDVESETGAAVCASNGASDEAINWRRVSPKNGGMAVNIPSAYAKDARRNRRHYRSGRRYRIRARPTLSS